MENQEIYSFKFIDFKSKSNPRTLRKSVVSCSVKSRQLAFSVPMSDELKEWGVKYFRLAYNELTEDVAFVLLKEDPTHKAIPVLIKKDRRANGLGNVLVCNSSMFKTLVELLKLDMNENFYLELSDNQSKRDDVKFYTVTLTEK